MNTKDPLDATRISEFCSCIGECRTIYTDYNGYTNKFTGLITEVDNWYVHITVGTEEPEGWTILHEAIVAIR